jgi:hypothetical protein
MLKKCMLGPQKCSHLSSVARHAFNVENHLIRGLQHSPLKNKLRKAKPGTLNIWFSLFFSHWYYKKCFDSNSLSNWYSFVCLVYILKSTFSNSCRHMTLSLQNQSQDCCLFSTFLPWTLSEWRLIRKPKG